VHLLALELEPSNSMDVGTLREAIKTLKHEVSVRDEKIIGLKVEKEENAASMQRITSELEDALTKLSRVEQQLVDAQTKASTLAAELATARDELKCKQLVMDLLI